MKKIFITELSSTKYGSKIEIIETIPLLITDWFQVDSINLLASNPFDFAGTKKSFGTAIYHCLTNTLTNTINSEVVFIHELK